MVKEPPFRMVGATISDPFKPLGNDNKNLKTWFISFKIYIDYFGLHLLYRHNSSFLQKHV